jgi:hypothetical protein
MRIQLIILFIFLLLKIGISEAANSRFFICTSANNKQAESYIYYFESQTSKALKKEFPCASISSQATVKALIELERQKQLFGTGDDNALENIAGAMGCDYLLNLKVDVLETKVSVSAFCLDMRKSKSISRITLSAALGDDGIDAVENVSKQMIEGLKKIEICPFKGSINVLVRTERTDKKTESYPVYCNGGDGLYKIATENNKNSDANWKLNKANRFIVNGSVSYNLHEESNMEEQNDCYTCVSGRQGPRLITEKKLKTIKIEGLSNESVSEGQPIDDARAEITFNEDGTYTLKVKATSKKGDLKERTEKKAEGTCDLKNDPPENINSKADVPLQEVTFGPFSGTSLDKVLSHKDTYSTVDPLTKEKTTITFDFNLKRD